MNTKILQRNVTSCNTVLGQILLVVIGVLLAFETFAQSSISGHLNKTNEIILTMAFPEQKSGGIWVSVYENSLFRFIPISGASEARNADGTYIYVWNSGITYETNSQYLFRAQGNGDGFHWLPGPGQDDWLAFDTHDSIVGGGNASPSPISTSNPIPTSPPNDLPTPSPTPGANHPVDPNLFMIGGGAVGGSGGAAGSGGSTGAGGEFISFVVTFDEPVAFLWNETRINGEFMGSLSITDEVQQVENPEGSWTYVWASPFQFISGDEVCTRFYGNSETGAVLSYPEADSLCYTQLATAGDLPSGEITSVSSGPWEGKAFVTGLAHDDQGISGVYLMMDGQNLPASLFDVDHNSQSGEFTLGVTTHLADPIGNPFIPNGTYRFDVFVVDIFGQSARIGGFTRAVSNSDYFSNVFITSVAERIRLRHECDVPFDRYRPDYFGGVGLFEINLIDYPDRLDIHLKTPPGMPLNYVNFASQPDVSRSQGIEVPVFTGAAAVMHKGTPDGSQSTARVDPAHDFYLTVTDNVGFGKSWSQLRDEGGTFTMEFTVNRIAGDQYYSSMIQYGAGKGKLVHQETDGRYFPAGENTVDPCSASQISINGDELNQASPNITLGQLNDFLDARQVFHVNHETGQTLDDDAAVRFDIPADNTFTGAGPFYTGNSCIGCHIRDGRGRPPALGSVQLGEGFLIKVAADSNGAPHPEYGSVLDLDAIEGFTPEGAVTIQSVPGPRGLNAPSYSFTQLKGGPVGAFSPRVAPHLSGLGLLEAVDDSTIEALAAQNGGKVQRVFSPSTGRQEIGRFGWKGATANLIDQVASAFANDMGVENTLFGAGNEISDINMMLMVEYLRGLGPLIRKHPDVNYGSRNGLLLVDSPSLEDLQTGEDLFIAAGCHTCHVMEMQTGNSHPWPQFRNITIRPFTDLLLHDMGPELADGMKEGLAGPQEWRTPPLWSQRAISEVNGHTRFLHDGRAANRREAILWHGGQAQASRQAFENMSATEQEELLKFLRSL